MKQWVTPELSELRAEWTQNLANAPGYDSVLEEIVVDGEIIEMGSCVK